MTSKIKETIDDLETQLGRFKATSRYRALIRCNDENKSRQV